MGKCDPQQNVTRRRAWELGRKRPIRQPCTPVKGAPRKVSRMRAEGLCGHAISAAALCEWNGCRNSKPDELLDLEINELTGRANAPKI